MRGLAAFGVLLMLVRPLAVCAQAKPVFRTNLAQFGYAVNSHTSEYSSIDFLSDDLLLIAVNQLDWQIAPRHTSTLVLLEPNRHKVLATKEMLIRPSPNAVAALSTGDFLVLSDSEITLCSLDLRCEKSFATKPFVTTLNADNLKLLDKTSAFVIRDRDMSADGTRTVACELRSTMHNKILHPLPIDEPSPPDFRLVSVYDARTKSTLVSLHYNPKNQLVQPAISPSGRKFAIVREGFLEVYNLP